MMTNRTTSQFWPIGPAEDMTERITSRLNWYGNQLLSDEVLPGNHDSQAPKDEISRPYTEQVDQC